MSTVLATNYSKSNPNKQYSIILANDGETVYCDCPGWKMSKDDPKMCRQTILQVREVMARDIPVFGICLGNQLLALAAGANTSV